MHKPTEQFRLIKLQTDKPVFEMINWNKLEKHNGKQNYIFWGYAKFGILHL